MRTAHQWRDRMKQGVRVRVLMGLNVLTFIENQCISMCYQIITKYHITGQKARFNILVILLFYISRISRL